MKSFTACFLATAGEIELRGAPVDFAGPAEAIAAGIGMVHQHFKLAPSFTVAENIILGAEPLRRFGRLDRAARRGARPRSSAERFGLDLDPRAIVGTLPVGMRQRVEILKALYRDARRPDPRRADRRADAAGDARNCSSTMRSLAGERPLDHLHHPQAARGARGRRPHLGDAAGPDRRRRSKTRA